MFFLRWALNEFEEMSFLTDLCGFDEIKINSSYIEDFTDPLLFINSKIAVRDADEILDANNLYYRLNWACVDANFKGIKIESLDPTVVYSRHFTLNWLINYSDQSWDNVTCDT